MEALKETMKQIRDDKEKREILRKDAEKRELDSTLNKLATLIRDARATREETVYISNFDNDIKLTREVRTALVELGYLVEEKWVPVGPPTAWNRYNPDRTMTGYTISW